MWGSLMTIWICSLAFLIIAYGLSCDRMITIISFGLFIIISMDCITAWGKSPVTIENLSTDDKVYSVCNSINEIEVDGEIITICEYVKNFKKSKKTK